MASWRRIAAVGSRRLCSSASRSPEKAFRVAVIGSGPAGFYFTSSLLRMVPGCTVEIYEKQPVPFGLVRFGVAPDHPEVKNCINQFQQLFAKEPDRLRFSGNVTVGRDLTVDELRQAYDAVVFAYGAETERPLGVDGDDAANCLSARRFVGWYNGLPQDAALAPLLDVETAVVLGQGNVALDVARVLLSPVDRLAKTDIAAHALDALSRSRVRRVLLVGRRGPLQVAFTIKELRELVNLPGSTPDLSRDDFDSLPPLTDSLARPRRRLTELMVKTATDCTKLAQDEGKSWGLRFRRSPVAVLKSDAGSVRAVALAVNRLIAPTSEQAKAEPTGETEELACGMLLASFGYRTVRIEGLPFDERRHVICTEEDGARVLQLPGVYACGWCARGASGVIATTQAQAKQCAAVVEQDAAAGGGGGDGNLVSNLLRRRGVRRVTWSDWLRIDALETARGRRHDKPREKLTDESRFMSIAAEQDDDVA